MNHTKEIKKQGNTIGITDLPINPKSDGNMQATDDLLGISKYVSGFVDFISTCSTPMTISLQGDWGSGKTSFMNVISDQLDNDSENPKVSILNFNTWKYSQFNQEDQLHISFITYLLTEIYGEPIENIMKKVKSNGESDEKNDSTINAIIKVITVIGLTAKVTLDASPTDYVQMFLGIFKRNKKSNIKNLEEMAALDVLRTNDSAKTMDELRKVFQQVVKERLEKDRTERIVIFIDDLDRLNPLIAVNLLEIIKLFVDVEKCVFVLAIDFTVVSEGLHAKFSNTNITQEKAQSFFDKIIQVPYSIPIEFYSFKDILKKNLKGFIEEESYFEELDELVRIGLGQNPRAIKRLLNSFYLINSIMKKSQEESIKFSDSDYAILLSILMIQLTHRDLYTLFIKSGAENVLEIFEESILEEEYVKFNVHYSKTQLSKQSEFLEHLRKFLKITELEVNKSTITRFEQLFQYSKVTGIENKVETEKRLSIPLIKFDDYDVKKAHKITTDSPDVPITKTMSYADIAETLIKHAVEQDPKNKEFINNVIALLEIGVSSNFIAEQIQREIESEAHNGSQDKPLHDYIERNKIKFNYSIARSRQVPDTSFYFNTNTSTEKYPVILLKLLKVMNYPYLEHLKIDIEVK